jgi:DNA-binding IclR family transcriptional regulator
MAGNTSQPGGGVIERIAAILAAFDAAHRELRLTDIAARAELALPTAHRLVGQLCAAQFLRRRDDGAYVIGRRLWDVGLLAPAQTDLRELASPFLHDLYAATLATVHLAVRDGRQALYIDRLAGRSSVPVLNTAGTRLPMHATGVGKVLLAFAPDAVQAQVLTELTRITPYTITQAGRLRRQLERVLQDGFAQTGEEMSLGACSIAVPVRDATERVVAALGVVVPTLQRERARLLSGLQVAAHGIHRVWSTLPPSEFAES